MPSRTELPWATIQREVLKAIKSSNNGKKFVDCGHIAEHIIANTESYPHFRNISYRATQGRIMMSLRKLGWTRWNGYGCGRAGVYIDPRVKGEAIPERED